MPKLRLMSASGRNPLKTSGRPTGAGTVCRLRGVAAGIRATLALWVSLALVVPACGYHFAGTGGKPPGGIQSIAVDTLKNQTAETGLEILFTNAILDEFIRWKKLAVKPHSEADAILDGRIRSIQTDDVSHFRAEQTRETRVTITLSLTLKRRKDGEVLWKNPSLSYYEEYLEREQVGSDDPLRRRRERRRAMEEIAEFLAEKVYQSIFEGF